MRYLGGVGLESNNSVPEEQRDGDILRSEKSYNDFPNRTG